jgi:hypothetical protein
MALKRSAGYMNLCPKYCADRSGPVITTKLAHACLDVVPNIGQLQDRVGDFYACYSGGCRGCHSVGFARVIVLLSFIRLLGLKGNGYER